MKTTPTHDYLKRHGKILDSRVSPSYPTVMEYAYTLDGEIYMVIEAPDGRECVANLKAINFQFGGF